MEIEIRAVGDLVPFVQFKKRKKPTVLIAISMIMTKLCDMSLERTSKHLFADPLFHRSFSNTLLVKTNYLVYWSEHWSKVNQIVLFVKFLIKKDKKDKYIKTIAQSLGYPLYLDILKNNFLLM